ncbi:hypothetical protein FORC47_p307 (plasmid) [Bacillus cereus]|nr:hypothetical protein FORC47_p307 [Bacillus cereus]
MQDTNKPLGTISPLENSNRCWSICSKDYRLLKGLYNTHKSDWAYRHDGEIPERCTCTSKPLTSKRNETKRFCYKMEILLFLHLYPIEYRPFKLEKSRI